VKTIQTERTSESLLEVEILVREKAELK